MAGDASLGITPVMKWNFERSCYRWLVTRHPAQFERLDFTAQILQSASRARKAFYECGWAEAKVLIRPSDGKFERTPFFDAIIRRGLRNSTRFDAATLTEEEIEALGMHRDETLGFKLQIRHFRSNRKELPPQGRARKPALPNSANAGRAPAGTVGRPLSSSNPVAASGGARGGGGGGGGRDVGGAHAPPVVVEQQPWRTESAAVARSPGDPRWTDEARWHRGVNGNGGPPMDGGGGGERWRAWDANRWMPGNDVTNVTAADERNHHRYNSHNAGPSHPPQHGPTSLVPGLAQASSSSAGVAAARRVVWDGPSPGRVWGGLERRPGPSWHPSAAAVDGRGDGFERIVPNGVSDGDGGRHDGFNSGGGRREQLKDSDVRAGAGAGFRFHQSAIEQQQQQQHPGNGRAPSGVVGGIVNGPSSGFRHGAVGIDGPVRGGSPDSSSAGAPGAGGSGSLLSQGYRRLAAMADERAVVATTAVGGGQPDASGGGGHGRRAAPLTAVMNHARRHSPVRSPLPHHYEGAAEKGLKRPAAGVVGNGSTGRGPVARVGHGQLSSRSLLSSPGGEDGPVKKKQRPSVDGGERAARVNGGGLAQQRPDASSAKRGRSGLDDKRVQPARPRGGGGALSNPSPAPGVQGDLLARELAESSRELSSARDALDLAQARFEEANRAHNDLIAAAEDQKQRSIEEAIVASQQQQQDDEEEDENRLEECASLHSLARSCEAAAASETDTAAPPSRAAAGGERQDDGRVSRASDAGDGNSDDGRNGDDVPVVRRSSAAAPAGRKSEGAGRKLSSSTGAATSSARKSCSSASADAECADEMREVKLEAALLCGIGRAPVSRRPATGTGVADKGLGIVSLAAAVAAEAGCSSSAGGNDKHSKVCGAVPRAAPRSSSSSPGGIRGGGGGLGRTSSAPHLPSLSLRQHHAGGGGGGGGARGGRGAFRPPASAAHPTGPAGTRGNGGGGGGGGGTTLPPMMAQMPGSPSGSGETDSDHSDSMGGAGGEDAAAESKQQHRMQRAQLAGGSSRGSGFSKAPSSAGRESWGGYSRRGRHVAGAHGTDGLSCA